MLCLTIIIIIIVIIIIIYIAAKTLQNIEIQGIIARTAGNGYLMHEVCVCVSYTGYLAHEDNKGEIRGSSRH